MPRDSAWRGEVTVNPVDGVRAPKSAKALPRLLSPDETNRLLEVASDEVLEIRDQAMYELFYSSGLRLAELAALDVDGLDDLLAGDVRVLGKRSKARLVPRGASPRMTQLRELELYRAAADDLAGLVAG